MNDQLTDKPWQLTQRQYQDRKAITVAGGIPILNAADAREHREIVAAALERGEAVPANVFKDYPDLWQPWTWTLDRWLRVEHDIQIIDSSTRYAAPTGNIVFWLGISDHRAAIRFQHEYEIKQALQRQERVPDVVLADYSHLASGHSDPQSRKDIEREIKRLDEEIKTLQAGQDVAYDVAINDGGDSLDRLERRIEELVQRKRALRNTLNVLDAPRPVIEVEKGSGDETSLAEAGPVEEFDLQVSAVAETEVEIDAEERLAAERSRQESRQDIAALARHFLMEEMEEEITELGYSIDAHDYIPAYMDIPPLYSCETRENPLAIVKLFTPDSNWTWYILEYNPEEDMAFGLVVGFKTELGYISIAELREVKGPMGLKVERDVFFRPTPITQVHEWITKWGEGGPYKSKAEPYVPAHKMIFSEDGGTMETNAYVCFGDDKYVVVNRYVDRDGTRYSAGWEFCYKHDSFWCPLFDPSHQGLYMDDTASLETVVAEAERVLGIRIELEGAPGDLPDSYPPFPSTTSF